MKKFLACAAAVMFACVGILAACGEEEEVKRELRNLPEDVTYKYETRAEEFTYTDEAVGEVKIYGEIYEPTETADGEYPPVKMPAVIMGHGYGGHYNDFPNECRRLAQRGYVAYSIDFCGAQTGGRSTGRTKDNYSPLTMQRDLVEAFKHIQSLSYVDETQVFLWGGSQGGFVAGLAAADDKIKDDVAGLVLYFPAFNIPNDHKNDPEQTVRFMGYYLNADYIRSIKDLDPFEVIPNYKKDVCILWGENDTLVKREYVDGAVEAYGADRAKLTVFTGAGAGHGFSGTVLTEAINTALTFLEAHTYKYKKK